MNLALKSALSAALRTHCGCPRSPTRRTMIQNQIVERRERLRANLSTGVLGGYEVPHDRREKALRFVAGEQLSLEVHEPRGQRLKALVSYLRGWGQRGERL